MQYYKFMNYLGIDYGERKIGLAKASGETKIATPLATVFNDGEVFARIADIIKTENIDIIVIGIPISFDGSENEFAERIRKFGDEIGRITSKQVEFENEIFSSKIASQSSPDKADESSAAIILQSFLDRLVKN